MFLRKELAILALSPNEKYLLIGILAVVMTLVVFFELRIMRGKNKEVMKVRQRKDEAYNAIHTTSKVMIFMQGQGKDTSTTERYLNSARQALSRNDFDRCMELCEKGREALTNPSASRSKSSVIQDALESDEEKDKFEEVAESVLSGGSRVGSSSGDKYVGTKLSTDKDANYLGAKFEMSAAKGDIGRAVHRGLDTGAAQDLLTQAESEYSTGNYTKALSLALKARKSIGISSATETIKLRVRREPEEPEAEPTAEESSGAPEILCHVCGAPIEADDTFCHKCGGKVPRERKCSSCGAKPRPTDMFCRKCGSRID